MVAYSKSARRGNSGDKSEEKVMLKAVGVSVVSCCWCVWAEAAVDERYRWKCSGCFSHGKTNTNASNGLAISYC